MDTLKAISLLEASKQALEALETCKVYDEADAWFDIDKVEEAADALRTAIEAAEKQEPVAYIRVSKTGHVMACAETGDFYALAHGTKLYTAPPAQEFVCSTGLCHYKTAAQRLCENCGEFGICCQQQQVPLMQEGKDFTISKPWVGLTDEERNHARHTVTYSQLAMTAGEWAEAVQIETEKRLKEKNT